MANTFSGYRALGNIDASTGLFTEITGGAYARQAVTLVLDSSGKLTNSAQLTYGPATGADWPSVGAIAIYDALTGGNLVLYYGIGSSAFVVALGSSRVTPANAMGVTFPAGGYTPHGTPVQLGEGFTVSGSSIIATAAIPAAVLKTGAYTIAASDHGTLIVTGDASAVTYTLPAAARPGTSVDVIQGGAGAILFSAGASATVSNRQSFTHSAGQYGLIRLRAISATQWVTSGDMTT